MTQLSAIFQQTSSCLAPHQKSLPPSSPTTVYLTLTSHQFPPPSTFPHLHTPPYQHKFKLQKGGDQKYKELFSGLTFHTPNIQIFLLQHHKYYNECTTLLKVTHSKTKVVLYQIKSHHTRSHQESCYTLQSHKVTPCHVSTRVLGLRQPFKSKQVY